MQSFMRQFSIRTRMVGAIGVVLLLLASIGGAGVLGMSHLQGYNQAFMDHAYAEAAVLAQLRVTMGDIGRLERDMLIAQHQEKLDKARDAHARWKVAVSRTHEALKTMTEGEEDEDNDVVNRIASQLQAYVKLMEPLAQQLESGAPNAIDDARRDKALIERDRQYQDMMDGLDKVAVILAEEAKSLQRADHETGNRILWSFMAALGLAVAVVVPTTLANMHSICQPLRQAHALAIAISTGDLRRQLQIEGRDEFAELMKALGSMQSELARMVGQVRSSTDNIQVASNEIAMGNQDLSLRTEQTASSLQETAASMEQLTSTVRNSADAARQANQLASSAAQIASRGGEVVSQVVSTMDEINHSSKKINDIIGVIDGIAFQTNILALNAAVEAARAGEQGRGFAVVAGEVRNLAQRSAQAAKEIKGLIGASVERVEVGSRLVADAGQTMSEIVGSVQRVSDIIGEITAAAGEQSEGIAQVNTAVSQLDQMTQQNAALVEQSAAAAQSLKEQAARLAETVQVFRVTSTHNPTVPSPLAATSLVVVAAPNEPPTLPKPSARSMPIAVTAVNRTHSSEGDWETF